MVAGNKSLGRFDLTDIPSAPRGIPQIEVAFDIDANGILNVSAKDKATGKEQSIVIKASSGLSDEEINNMVKDAEAHAEEDRQAKELVEARNLAENLVYSTKKSIDELGDKVEEQEKKDIEAAIADVEEAVKGNDKEVIEEKTRKLTEVAGKLAEKAYQQAAADDANGEDKSAGANNGAGNENVVDAEFEEVDDNKK
jgi:molecular chaperone DnaK